MECDDKHRQVIKSFNCTTLQLDKIIFVGHPIKTINFLQDLKGHFTFFLKSYTVDLKPSCFKPSCSKNPFAEAEE